MRTQKAGEYLIFFYTIRSKYILLEGLNYPYNKYLDLQKADCKKHAKHNRRYRSFLGFLLSYSILYNDIRNQPLF